MLKHNVDDINLLGDYYKHHKEFTGLPLHDAK
jgi:hypothetical protein